MHLDELVSKQEAYLVQVRACEHDFSAQSLYAEGRVCLKCAIIEVNWVKMQLAEAVARAEKSETLLQELIAEVFGVREGVTEHTAAEAIARVNELVARVEAAEKDRAREGGRHA